MTTRVVWLDCSSGVSGDMLLGALTAVGALDLPELVCGLDLDATCRVEQVTRGGIAAVQVHVDVAVDQPHRRLADVLAVVAAAPVPEQVRRRAAAVFERLARAEARVHGTTPDQVEFHEVGAVDAVVDVLGACAGLHALAVDAVLASPLSLGGGTTRSLHGPLPVPGPAVLELLRQTDLVARGGPVDVELATPTGVAVLAEWARPAASMPPMQVEHVGVGAGGRDLEAHPNVLRLVAGMNDDVVPAGGDWLVVETNVDDLDPRVWPIVLDRLLAAGAADAWLTPILMKKGRPAHTLAALVPRGSSDGVAAVIFEETSAIGLRTHPVAKTALERDWVEVDVEGQSVRVKVARRDGLVVNLSPEFDDVTRAAEALGRPVKTVLAAAAAAGARAVGIPSPS